MPHRCWVSWSKYPAGASSATIQTELNHVTSAPPHPQLLPFPKLLLHHLPGVSRAVLHWPPTWPPSPQCLTWHWAQWAFLRNVSSELILSDMDSTQASTHLSRTHIRWFHPQPKPSDGHSIAFTMWLQPVPFLPLPYCQCSSFPHTHLQHHTIYRSLLLVFLRPA